MTASLTRLQESVESLQQHHLMAPGCQWSEQILEQAKATGEFVQTGGKYLEHIDSSVETLFNQQLIEDKPTGWCVHTRVCVEAKLLCYRDDSHETRFHLPKLSVPYKTTW